MIKNSKPIMTKSNENLSHCSNSELRDMLNKSKSLNNDLPLALRDQSLEELECISPKKDENDENNHSYTKRNDKQIQSKFVNYLDDRPVTYCVGQTLVDFSQETNTNLNNTIFNNESLISECKRNTRGFSLVEPKTSSSLRPFFRSFLNKNNKLKSIASCPSRSDLNLIETASQNSIDIQSNYNYRSSTTVIMNTNLTAVKNFETHLGYELASKLVFDQSNMIPNNDLSNSTSLTSIASNLNSKETTADEMLNNSKQIRKSSKSPQELDQLQKQKAHEYCNIEEKQANLLKLLNNNIYKKFQEYNAKQQFSLCDSENVNKIFFVIVELSKFSELVHGEIATKLKNRLDNEWNDKPYFGDILIERHQFYQAYIDILRRYPDCQIALSKMLIRRSFSNYIKQLLEFEALGLGNVNRIDILLDRLVDFPRRSLQLLESYKKNLEINTQEYINIEKVVKTFEKIFLSSNNALNKTMNFQQCYSLKDVIDGTDIDFFHDRLLIKQGPIYKVSKRSGETQLRHLSLLIKANKVTQIEKDSSAYSIFIKKDLTIFKRSHMLLVCKVDKLKKNLKLNHEIKTKDIKLIEYDENEELKFRIISSQNNQFIADSKRHREDWLKAFSKVKNLKTEVRTTTNTNGFRIGVDPPPWIPDSCQNECYSCNESFNTFRRRHHCRTCGSIFCGNCCKNFVYVEFNKDDVRVCNKCYDILTSKSAQINSKNTIVNTSIPQQNDSSESKLETNIINEEFKAELLQRINENKKNNIDSDETVKSNSLVDITTLSLSSSTSSSPPAVVIRREISGRKSKEDDSSSSSLTEEQMNFIGKIMARSSYGESSDELDTNHNSDVSSKNDDVSLSVNTDTNGSFNETTENSQIEKSLQPCNRIGRHRNAFKMRSIDGKDVDNQSDIISNNRSTNSIVNKQDSSCRKIIMSEYGYLCKTTSKSQESTLNEINERNNLERKYFIFYSDNTLGICSNSNEAPNLIVNLGLYKINNLDDKSFELVRITNTDSNHLMISHNDIFKRSNSSERNNNKLTAIKSMFELNYKIKFTNKDIKAKWCNLMLNHNNVST